MIKIVHKVLAFTGLLSLCFLFIYALNDAPTDENYLTKLMNDYNVYAVQIPENLDFAGEPMPLKNSDVLERMDKELLVNTYWQSNTLLMIKRAKRFFPVIEPILAKYNIPDDFKYLAVIESGLTNAVSPAGARGFWQIMPETAKEYGLEVNQNVDERYHLEKATEVACKYLQRSKNQLGSWTLAAAAYNAGTAGVSKKLKDQEVNAYYDLLLGDETGRYVFRIVALKEIITNPKLYGFNFRDEDLYKHIPTTKVQVDTDILSIAKFAKEHNLNYKTLKLHNPWLREAHLTNKTKKVYQIDIPQPGYYD